MPAESIRRIVEAKLIELADIFEAAVIPPASNRSSRWEWQRTGDLSHRIPQLRTDSIRRRQTSRVPREEEDSGFFQAVPKGSNRIHPGVAHVIFHEPIDPAKFASRGDLMRAVRTAVASGLPEWMRT